MSITKSNKQDIKLDWEELFFNSPGGNIVTDIKGNILEVNETLLTWLGYKKGELKKDKKFQDLLPVGGKLFYETQHIIIVKIQGFLNEINYEILNKKKERIQVLVNSTYREHHHTKDIIIHHLIVPYVERKKLEIELVKAKKNAEKANQAKSDFLSTITHEIRTPINTILGISDFLLQEQPSKEQLEMLSILRNSSINLNELISNILDLNKMEAGKLVLHNKAFDLISFIYELRKAFLPEVRKKRLGFQLEIDKKITGHYIGDSLKIRQILNNLISNAIKFTKFGELNLSLKLLEAKNEKHQIRFTVKDTGIGMQRTEIDKIFHPFTQANEEISTQFGGTGLGLTITQKLLGLFDSQLIVKSKPDKGSSFYFDLTLPQITQAKSISTTQQKTTSSYELEKLPHANVLIVDDNHSNLFIATRYLEKWNVNYLEAHSGSGAILAIEKEKFDLVFLDLRMPNMDGYETISIIRTMDDGKYKDLPIIAFSASSSFEFSIKMQISGFNDFVLKPIDPFHFHQVIRKYTIKEEASTPAPFLNTPLEPTLIKENIKEFSLDRVLEFYDHENESIQQYLILVKKDVEEFISNISTTEKQDYLSTLGDVFHNMQTTLQLFNLTQLRTTFEYCTHLNKERDKKEIQKTTLEILEKLKVFHSWLEEKCD